jgi:hypothetical protein
MTKDSKAAPSMALPNRSCGTCTLCCKVYDVPVLSKPAGSWCTHCKPGKGCGIHATRPDYCRDFNCLWMMTETMGPEWKPERCRFVMTINPVHGAMVVQVDPGSPTAWRQEPYYAQLKVWAAAGAEQGRATVVYVNRHATVVLPDRDVTIGIIAEDEGLNLVPTFLMGRPTFDVRKVRVAG